MKVFRTIYRQNGKDLGCHVHAVDREAAEAILTLRGLGEKISKQVPYRRRLSGYRLYWDDEFIPLLHYLTFVGGIALRAGIVSVEELLITEVEGGLIHPLIHEIEYGKKHPNYFFNRRYAYMNRLKEFDRKVKSLGF